MTLRHADGSAGDADYGPVGGAYSQYRQPEPRIARFIEMALGDARTVLNVGAGAGSYEPPDRQVIAVEPSASMRAQRPPHLSPAIDAIAENLPFPDAHFEAAMATFTVHQWSNFRAGLHELRRVTRGPAIVLTCDPDRVRDFWLNDYAPTVLATEARRYPVVADIVASLGGCVEVHPVPIPLTCRDGFNEAYYGRPECLLNPAARLACSAWSFIKPVVVDRSVQHLRDDLAAGIWDRTHGHLRTQSEFSGSLRLIVART